MAIATKTSGGWSQHRWRIAGWSAAVILLLLPLVAMQLTDEVAWDAADFIFFGILLGSVGFAIELTARKSRAPAERAAAVVAVLSAFFMVWANEAVGILGSEDNGANLMFYGVLAVGLAGAVLARFEPRGMALAMGITALAQALVGVIALATGAGAPQSGPVEVLLVTGVFVTLWTGSAWLFLRSSGSSDLPAEEESGAGSS